MKKILIALIFVVGAVAGVGVWAHVKNLSGGDLVAIGKGMVKSRVERHSVEERVAAIVAKKPGLKAVAKSAAVLSVSGVERSEDLMEGAESKKKAWSPS